LADGIGKVKARVDTKKPNAPAATQKLLWASVARDHLLERAVITSTNFCDIRARRNRTIRSAEDA
jgi:hypothetical protein